MKRDLLIYNKPAYSLIGDIEICKLKYDKYGNCTSIIEDEELDLLDVRLSDTDCIEIDTSKMQYILLSEDNLYQMLELIDTHRNNKLNQDL